MITTGNRLKRFNKTEGIMDYVYLPIQSGFRIRKSTMISVLNDIIAAENGNVDMREIGAKYGLFLSD